MKIRSRQRGYALLVLVALLMAAAASVTVKALNHSSSNVQIARGKITAAALAQAKDALISYAVTYSDMHPGEVYGYLPCPDMSGGNPDGSAEINCSGKNISAIGRMPWRTLDLVPLLGGDRECLWYAVSGTHKNNTKTDAMNWDTNGQLKVYSSDGTTLITPADNQAVAVIFGPGDALPGQNRSSTATPYCGGNYTAGNYLDAEGDFDNATVSASANATSQFRMGFTAQINDILLLITADDIFRPVIRHNYFRDQITALLDDADLRSQAGTVNITGTKGSDKIICNDIANINNRAFCNNWLEMLLLAQLSSAASITIDGAATPPCNRVLIFGGRKTGAQVRLTDADKSNPDNYLEATNLSSFKGSTSNFVGTSTFNANNPSADLLRCLA